MKEELKGKWPYRSEATGWRVVPGVWYTLTLRVIGDECTLVIDLAFD